MVQIGTKSQASPYGQGAIGQQLARNKSSVNNANKD